jgi:hypothetical protein
VMAAFATAAHGLPESAGKACHLHIADRRRLRDRGSSSDRTRGSAAWRASLAPALLP